MDKIIYFIRHGETEANHAGRAQGPDEPLSPTGEHQADQLAERVSHLSFGVLLSSEYTRAQQTAARIAERCHVPIELAADLHEVVSLTMSETDSSLINEMVGHVNDDAWFEARGLESYRDIHIRATTVLQLLAQHAESTIVVVTHGVFLKFIAATVLLGESATPAQLHRLRCGLRVSNTGVSKCIYTAATDAWQIEQWNDVRHFAS